MRKPAKPPVDESRPAEVAARPCPICGKPAVAAFRPFCSQRCADVDLNRWLGGVYAAPVTAAEEDADEPPAQGGGDK